MRRPRQTFLRWAAVSLAVVLIVGAAGVALAQTDVTSTRITGTVKDADGGVLPGGTVEARSQDTGFTVTVVTDSKGSYRILNLPTGTYTVTVSLAGFATERHPDIRLLLSSPATVDFTMKLAGKTESIVVTSDVPLVEATNTSASTTIQTEQIKQLPVSGRNFMNLVLAMPETTTKNERGYTALSGQRGINTSFYVDGVDDNNPFFGGVIGQAEGRSPLQISQESIKEFSVVTNGASVEMGRSGGGFVNVITKSGTNAFKGSVWYYNQPQSLLANNALGVAPKDQKKSQYGAAFGGPIVNDKLFFFGSYDRQKQDLTQNLQPWVSDPAIAAKYPSIPITGNNYVQTADGNLFFGRLDFQFSGSHRLTARANYADYTGQNGTYSSATDAPGHNGIERMLARSYVGSYSGMFGSNWLDDANAQWVIEDTPRLDQNATFPEIQVKAGGTTQTGLAFGGATYGGVAFLPINPTQVQRKSFSDSLTYTFKDHVLKGGVDYNDTSVAQIFKGNWRGVYIFNSETDFLAGKWSQYRQFGGLNGLTADQAGLAAFHQKESALFVQDQWFISPGLTASLGVRWESLNNPDGPTLNLNSKNADGSYNLNGQIPDDTGQLSPRLGLSWAPGESSKTVFRVSAGRFYARTPGILFSQLYTSNGRQGTQYTVNWNNGGAPTDPLAPGWGGSFNPNVTGAIDFSKVPNPKGLGVFAISPNFKNPYTDRITFGWDQQLFKDTALNMDFTYAKSYQLERLTDSNIQYALNADGTVKLSPVNGQPMYSSTRPDAFYGRVTTYMSDAQSKYTAVVMTLRRQFTERLFGFLAVTWSQDFDNDSNERNYSGVQAEDFNNIAKDWAYSIRDQRWKVALNGVWNSPWWGMSLSGVYRYTSGSPFTPVTSSDANSDGFFNDRPTIGGVHLGRNSYRYPAYYSLDLRLQKAVTLGPGKAAVIVECFNCSNNSNWSISNTTWGNNQTPLATFNVQNTPTTFVRTFQLAVRYDF